MMKLTFGWLKEHLKTDRSLDEIAGKLTMIGLEVERIEDKAKLFVPFVIARVIEAKPHPNADRLRVCLVDTGDGKPIQVVCGAPNARTGMTGVFSPPGTWIPGKKITLGVGTIPGVESRGMLVSEAEMELSDDHDGIIDLPADALVDITNFMTFDRGRPLHVFDAKRVHGNLTVRRARKGESLLALDGRSYQLDENICVIADEKAVESLAGIMGGEASGCDANTTEVLIESALWSPLNIAQTGRKLGINSDARYRFERGVDPSFMVPGLEQATAMVVDFCGGSPSEIVVAGEAHADDRVITFPVAEVKRLSGLDVPLIEMKRVLGH